jgi:serine protease AprX
MARRVFFTLAVLATLSTPLAAQPRAVQDAGAAKLDAVLQQRARVPAGTSQVIVRTRDGQPATLRIRSLGGVPGRHLAALGGQVARVPDAALYRLAAIPDVTSISLDRPVQGALQESEPTGEVIGARWVNEHLGFDGSGVGVALIDSGVTAWHEDLDPGRVVHFVDFINSRTSVYDDYGHGTHVAGIIAGNGLNSDGARRGIAPGASLIVLKALDGAGGGYISNVIAAIDYAIAVRETYNIRIINLSVSAGVFESYEKDPLTLAAKRAVDAGLIVVAAAGNLGRSASDQPLYGGIAAPGNAPWVLTVGATSHKGTVDRRDDEVARFSSRGPAAIDGTAKPDLVAPGVAIQSLAEPSSVLFAAHPADRLWGTLDSISEPYLRLTGTSMAAPVVAATAALMLDANPSLSPNAVKAILQYTAEVHVRYDNHTQGAGFLNARGAVELAANFNASAEKRASQPAAEDPVEWSRQLVWGNLKALGGRLTPGANAWQPGVVWGASRTPLGDPVVWGTLCAPADAECTNSPWTIEGTKPRGNSSDIPDAADGRDQRGDRRVLPAVRDGWPVEAGRIR